MASLGDVRRKKAAGTGLPSRGVATKDVSWNGLPRTSRNVTRLAESHLGQMYAVVVLGQQRGESEHLEAIAGDFGVTEARTDKYKIRREGGHG